MKIKIHFFPHQEDKKSTPLAEAMGGGHAKQSHGPDADRYLRLRTEAPNYFQLAELGDADICMHPNFFDGSPGMMQAAEEAQAQQKPCCFFHQADSATPIVLPWGTCFRASLLASRQTPCERVFPAFADDLLREYGGEVPLRPYHAEPTVGFCGYVGTWAYRCLYTLQGRMDKVRGLSLRSRLLKTLSQTPEVRCNFIRRDKFWGGGVSRFGSNQDVRQTVRTEYLTNTLDSDYVMCVRGAGNFSYRFYEALSMGRIPLFVNTDCELPFAKQIDWRSHCVWVEEEEMDRAGSILREFHASLTAEQFHDLQRRNRKMWEDYLRPLEAYRLVCEGLLANRDGSVVL